MSGMPYHLEKGPIISVLEAFANQDTQQLGQALVALRDPKTPLVKVGVVDSKTLAGGPFANPAQLVAHINKHWLGMTLQGGSWAPQPAFDLVSNPTTGHWQRYYGPVEQILRETFIRAAEVSLGLDHGAPVPLKPPRHWPVEFFWKCPQPWFEGWVTWRCSQGGDPGQVTVILATPADTGVVLDSPVNGRNPVVDPVSTQSQGVTARQGMWVVTAMQHKQKYALTTTPGPGGQWVLPGSVWRGEGRVVTVAPSEEDGGVKAQGRPYQKGWV